ncbi:SDR family oxidoreductase [Nonomuraea sp. NPDC005650]|uniref:SDR family oxidoreductase n=1 Tax=Nonomuraea sp. NPDC005650 TaxID=3157045 RepID=UPI0033BA3396
MSNRVWEPITLGRLTLRHRFALSPMTRSRALPDGTPGPSAARYYAQRASLGLVISEGTQPSEDGQGYPLTPGIFTEDHVVGWRKIADAVHEAGGHLFIQLMHAGRLAHPDNTPHHRQPVGVSAVAPGAPIFTAAGLQQPPTPRELAEAEIPGVIAEFRDAARKAVEAGADGVELHGAGGYLIHSFLGVNSNIRTDAYGGSVAGRARFVLELVSAVADEIGADRTAIRLSPYNTHGDVDEGADGLELYRHLARSLNSLGLAYLHIYDFGREDVLTAIRTAWTGPLLVVRDGRTRDDLVRDLDSGLADVVPIGRLALANPDFVERFRQDAPMNDVDQTAMFGGGDEGYIDYPTLAEARQLPGASMTESESAPMNTDMTLHGTTALVTGATAGIGRAVALALAGHGATVVAHGRHSERGAELIEEINGQGGKARFIAADLTDADDVLRLAADAGDVDILVNNAGIYELAGTPGTDVAGFDRQFAVNTRAPFLLVGALAPAMAERGRGFIVNINSRASTFAAPVGAAYGASKAAVDVLTRYWATEFGANGVRVNGISPGMIRTAGTTAMFGDGLDALGGANLRGRIGEPEEIAQIVLFLVSEASSYINGTVIAADGGELSTAPS